MFSSLAASGLRVPDGFATTADAYREFAEANELPQWIAAVLDDLNVDDVTVLVRAARSAPVLCRRHSAKSLSRNSRGLCDAVRGQR
jgi:phosphoenolpyruvate synthase/pyruvate phosphate dikinase